MKLNYLPQQYKKNKSLSINHSYLIEQFSDYKKIFKILEKTVNKADYTLGEEVNKFEKNISKRMGSKNTIAVGNGTDALFLVLKALDIKAGDEIITTPFTFIATVASIVTVGAKPVFVDIKDDYNINEKLIQKAITKKTKGIMAVNWSGRPCELDKISSIAKKNNLKFIQDACHSIDSNYKKKPIVKFSDACTFSLHPLKNLNVWGDGGIVVTNNDSINHELRLLRNHGLKSRDHCERFGYNSRLDTVQAVVAEHMLEKIEAITEKRIHNALYLDKQLGRMSGVQVPVRDLDIHRQVFHIYSLTFEKRDELKLFLESKGIDAKIHYPTPIHLQPAAKKFVENSDEYPVAEQLARSTLSLPVHEFITEQQLDFIVGAIKEFYS